MNIPETDSEDEVPPGWEERCTTEGLVFYANHETKGTQWEHPRTRKQKRVPREIPFGWERKTQPNGSVVFIDHINGKMTITDPRLAFAVERTDLPKDLRQRHGNETTGMQVTHGLDLSQRIAVITGATGGIGFETARSLVLRGCHVVFACRDKMKTMERIARVRSEASYSKCSAFTVDLSSFHSTKLFACEFKRKIGTCDMLILSAGVFGLPFTKSADNIETTMQVNFLSHFYLALLFRPLMMSSSLARIVFVTAESHRFANINLKNELKDAICPRQEDYLAMVAYNNSKFCCILACLELHRRYGDSGFHCFAAHPGNLVNSGLSRHWLPYRILFALASPFSKTLQQACASIVYCASSADLKSCGGMYINNCAVCPPSEHASDLVLANALWTTTIEIIEERMGRNAFSLDS